jgi:hypothetical protein
MALSPAEYVETIVMPNDGGWADNGAPFVYLQPL